MWIVKSQYLFVLGVNGENDFQLIKHQNWLTICKIGWLKKYFEGQLVWIASLTPQINNCRCWASDDFLRVSLKFVWFIRYFSIAADKHRKKTPSPFCPHQLAIMNSDSEDNFFKHVFDYFCPLTQKWSSSMIASTFSLSFIQLQKFHQ